MIRLFRKIRHQLLEEDKYSTYFLYAIGEVFLVIAGILLAFQIDRWNEVRKQGLLEKEMLREVLAGLDTDLKDIEYNLNAQETSLLSQNIIINWLNGNQAYQDSLGVHFSNVSKGSVFISNEGPYETLKQMGVRLIKNAALRDQISKVYDLQYQDYKDHVEFYYDFLIPFVTKINAPYFEATTFLEGMKPLNIDIIKSDHEYSYQIKTIRNFNEYYIQTKIAPTKRVVEETIRMIKSELEIFE